MQTITGRRYFKGRSFRDIREMLRQCAELYGDRPAFIFHDKPGGVEMRRTYRNLLDDIQALGTGLRSKLQKKSHVAIYSDNSYEWIVAYNSIVSGNGIAVPLDKLLPEREVSILLARGEVEVLFFGPKQMAAVQALAEQMPELRCCICMDLIPPKEGLPADPRFVLMSELLAAGRDLLQHGNRDFIDSAVDPEALAVILFTSGTTAQAKGVMLSQDNICSNIQSISGVLRIDPGDRVLSILPLHHSFENTVGMFTILYYGGCICFCDGLRYFTKNLQEWQIQVMIGVPLLFENVHKKIMESIATSGKTRQVALMRPVVRTLFRLGIDVRRKVFKEIIHQLGGKLYLVVIGAAAIDRETIQCFTDFGLTFYMGYGLTESAPCVASCNHKVNVLGSVGEPISGVEIAIDTQETEPGAIGEILTRSRSVMLGYYHDPEATSETLTPDGWLRTGDMGYLDRNGAIFLTGRAKSMIVLTNGKKAFPEEIENILQQIPGVVESVVWGEPGERENIDICALLRIERTQLPLPQDTDDARIGEWLNRQLKEANHKMPSYKAVHYFLFTENDLVKTTTMKIRRNAQLDVLHELLHKNQLTMHAASGRKLETLPPV